MTVIGKVAALEQRPTTTDEFFFWTPSNRLLSPFDVVVVPNANESLTFGAVEEVNHITDAASYLSTFVSSDFGDLEARPFTHRIGMNYVKARVLSNTKGIMMPAQHGAAVRLASAEEAKQALGIAKVETPLPCGHIEMYSHVADEKVTIPVFFEQKFLIGPEGAHLNISGISGLAAKTSYCMFLLKALQDRVLADATDSESVAFVVFNVKGTDLLHLEEPTSGLSERDVRMYGELGVETKPFQNVRYHFPFHTNVIGNTYASAELVNSKVAAGVATKFKYTYAEDGDSLPMLLGNVDDPTGTMESACDYIMSRAGGFSGVKTWNGLLDEVANLCVPGSGSGSKEVSISSWRKFKRVVSKPLHNCVFAQRVEEPRGESRLAESLQGIKGGEVHVVDIARLDETLQSFVFGNAMRAIYDLKLGQVEGANEDDVPDRIVIFVDELNKYAGADCPKASPILRQTMDIAERGRSLGIVLFGAEQFKSAIHDRVKGNCGTHAYGRTNSIEIAKNDYRYIPSVYKNMMVRLRQGEYIVTNPMFPGPLLIHFPKPLYRQPK
jgi:hypothetical protein